MQGMTHRSPFCPEDACDRDSRLKRIIYSNVKSKPERKNNLRNTLPRTIVRAVPTRFSRKVRVMDAYGVIPVQQCVMPFLCRGLFHKEDTPLINRQHIHFLHGGAPAHFSRTARRYLERRFPDRWIGRGGPIAWPPRSPDLNPLDFYLWGRLKSLVYSSPVPDLESLRNRIVACSEDIRNTPGVWDRVRRSMRHRCRGEEKTRGSGSRTSRKEGIVVGQGRRGGDEGTYVEREVDGSEVARIGSEGRRGRKCRPEAGTGEGEVEEKGYSWTGRVAGNEGQVEGEGNRWKRRRTGGEVEHVEEKGYRLRKTGNREGEIKKDYRWRKEVTIGRDGVQAMEDRRGPDKREGEQVMEKGYRWKRETYGEVEHVEEKGEEMEKWNMWKRSGTDRGGEGEGVQVDEEEN
ncbi:hypothetical protein ANN_18018 [Periplaneta americana]|uniref:Uncharacterized protein n=1 Tax=Periplaneta americana TaxID=6978 RepID=A0ABQ8SML3_PERAM|nr:hypothetical protein ANN_18018 [Periplaneta americana]